MKVTALLAAALLTAGCAELTTTGVPADSTAPAAASLEATGWSLTGGPGMDAEEHPATARFAGGTLTGQAPVNSYTASYEVQGESMTIGPIASTKKAGEPAAMAAEDDFLRALGSVAAYSVTGEELQLLADGEPVLVFAAAPDDDGGAEAEEVAAGLVGMPAAQAQAAVEAAGLTYRVVAEDGEGKAATDDVRADRINVEVQDGTVTKATVG